MIDLTLNQKKIFTLALRKQSKILEPLPDYEYINPHFAPKITYSNNWNWEGNHYYYRVDCNPFNLKMYFSNFFGGLREC